MNDHPAAHNEDLRWNRFLDEALLSPAPLVLNAPLPTIALEVDGLRMPVTLNHAGLSATSWVASVTNAYGPYARAEIALVKMHTALRPLCSAASHAVEALLGAGGLAGGAFLNNWVISTNLHPEGLTARRTLTASAVLAEAYPDLPVVLRSLTPSLHSSLMADLVREGWLLVPSRQVWLNHAIADGSWRQRSDVKRDQAMAARNASEWEWVPAAAFSDVEFERATRLYQDLYRKRYPGSNPDYTEAFLRAGVATGWLQVTGLRRRGEQHLCGVLGILERAGRQTTPIFGFELDAPVADGLYRRLNLKTLLTAEAAGALKHCSAGAGYFKQQRGATCHVEFAAVDARHLSAWRRGTLRALTGALRAVAVPYLTSRPL